MSEPYVGEIRCFGFNFAPRDWALCNGQLMAIQQNPTLYAILGTTYGGDGVQTFALPDLRGRAPMHWGATAGGTGQTVIGEQQGLASVTLLTAEIPQHTHQINAVDPGTLGNRTPNPTAQSYLSAAKSFIYQKTPVTPNAIFSPRSISLSGGSLGHDNMQPYLAVNFSIALFGIFPSRN